MVDKLNFLLFLLGPPLVGECLFLFFLARRKGGPARRHSLLRAVLVNLSSCLLILFLMCVGGELYYRFAYDTTESFGLTKVTRSWVDRYFVQNSAGYRDNIQYSKFIEPGKRRVSFVGDSFTVGQGISSVEDRFANIIRRDQTNWEVHVLAQLGLDTGAELQMLKTSLDDGYQVDRVVLVYCLNDVADLMPEWDAKLKALVRERDARPWLFRHCYFLDLLYYRVKMRNDPMVKSYFDFVRGGYQGPMWETQKLRLAQFRDLVQSHGAQLSVVTFPFLHALGPDYEYRGVHEELAGLWRELGVPHLDLLPVYEKIAPDKLTVNRYDSHPNEYASALAAVQIEAFLKTNLVVTTNR